MARRGVVDQGLGTAILQSFVEQLAMAQEKRHAQQQAIRELLVKEQIEERTPERIAQRLGLETARQAGETASPPGGFSRAELQQPKALERAFAPVRQERVRQALQQFGLIKPSPSMEGQPVFTIDPTTGQMINVGSVPRGSRVVPQPSVPLEKTTAVISAESSLRTLNELRSMVGEHPERLLTRGVPGVQGARELDRIVRNLELEIVTARGGKQLTPSERQLIRQVFPNRLDALDALMREDPSVIQGKIDELEQKALDLIGRIPVRGSPSQPHSPQTSSRGFRLISVD